MAGQVRRTQAERRSQSEQALLDAATALIAREGVSAVTFEALGRAGGFSRGLAGLRFGSKAGLIEAVLQYAHKRQEGLVAAQGLERLSGLEALLGYVDLCLQDISHGDAARAYFKLLSWSVAESHEASALFAEIHGMVRQRLHDWIAQGQQDGSVRPGIDPGEAALVVGSMMLGVNMQALVDPSGGAKQLRQAVATMLQASLAVQR